MARPSAPESQSSDSFAAELANVDALGLIDTAERSAGVETNLVLLKHHSDIVAKALAELGRTAK